MKIIAVTGGVGAGKSKVLSYLHENHRAAVIQADEVGHLVMKKGQPCHKKIVEEFGCDILDEQQEIDRKKLGALVFSCREKLELLNSIVHPAVKTYIFQEIETYRREGCRLLALEAALIFEEHYDEICDDLWYIYVDDAVRRQRLRESRGYSDEKISDILRNQMSDEEFRRKCFYVVENNGDLKKTYEQIDKRIQSYGIM